MFFFGMDRGVVGVHLIRLKFGGIFFEMFLEHSVHFWIEDGLTRLQVDCPDLWNGSFLKMVYTVSGCL